jgi:hypothetical protein
VLDSLVLALMVGLVVAVLAIYFELGAARRWSRRWRSGITVVHRFGRPRGSRVRSMKHVEAALTALRAVRLTHLQPKVTRPGAARSKNRGATLDEGPTRSEVVQSPQSVRQRPRRERQRLTTRPAIPGPNIRQTGSARTSTEGWDPRSLNCQPPEGLPVSSRGTAQPMDLLPT